MVNGSLLDCEGGHPTRPELHLPIDRHYPRVHVGGLRVVPEPRRSRAPPVGAGRPAGHPARTRQGQRRHLRRHHDQLHRSVYHSFVFCVRQSFFN